jgi:hypothetical protein
MANGNQAAIHIEVLPNASLLFQSLTCGSHSDGMQRCGGTTTELRTGHEVAEVNYNYSSTLSVTSALDWGVLSTPRPGRFTPGIEPGTHCTGRWVGPRVGLNGCGKSRHRDSISGPSSPQPVVSRPILQSSACVSFVIRIHKALVK